MMPLSSQPPDPRRWRILIVLLLAGFTTLVSVGIANVALPSIRTGLGASDAQLQWVLAGYALTFGVLLVASGRAGDVYGRGAFFIGGVLIFTASSVWAGFAPDAQQLVVARFIQGLGASVLNPQSLGLIQQYFAGQERGVAFGVYGASAGVAFAIGPLLGGIVIDGVGGPQAWRWTFLINVPVGLLAILLALWWFPRPLWRGGGATTDPPSPSKTQVDLDPVGALLLGGAVFAGIFPFVQTDLPHGWLLVVLAVVLAAFWVGWERRYLRSGRAPMVDLAIFSTASFSNGSALISFYFLGATSIWVLIALHLQEGLGYSALVAGAVGVPHAVLSGLSSYVAGKHVIRLGRIVVIWGILTVLAGVGASALVVWLYLDYDVSVWWLLGTLGIVGLGQGAVISPNHALTLSEVPLTYAGSSGGVMQTGQRIASSVGIALVTGLMFASMAGGPRDAQAWTQASLLGFAAIAVAIGVALSFAVRDWRRSATGRQELP